MGLVYPAPDFALYGLDSKWQGPRWPEFFDGERSGPTLQRMWLAHGTTPLPEPARPWVAVGTEPLQLPVSTAAAGIEPVQEVAFTAMFALVSRTAPELHGDARRAYWQRAVNLADEGSRSYGAWPTVPWEVDGAAVEARYFVWAGAWAGFTTDVADVAIVLFASGVPPESLALARIDDSSSYHFEAREPLAYPDVLEASVATALAAAATPAERYSWPLHPDQERLLRS